MNVAERYSHKIKLEHLKFFTRTILNKSVILDISNCNIICLHCMVLPLECLFKSMLRKNAELEEKFQPEVVHKIAFHCLKFNSKILQ